MDLTDMTFPSRQSGGWTARAVGLAVFLTGVGLLVVVFIWASATLTPPAIDTKKPLNLGFLGTKLAWELARLFLLGFVASVIAGRGIQMYAVAGRSEAATRSPLE
jgi:hypothetical protein